ncbi:MAG: GntR family transcriptional regulator [Sedimentisphaeraceae bacterium JB056]
MFVTSQQKAYTKIKSMILEGEFSSGERIPETKVAKLIGMKRGPVRESLIKLESDGLLVSEPHFGFATKTYTLQETQELYELREVVEGGAAYLAAKNANNTDIDRLIEAHEVFKAKIDTNDELRKNGKELSPDQYSNSLQDEAFHRAILKASKNSRFSNVFRNISDEHICLTLHFEGKQFYKGLYDYESYEHHDIILKAIIERNSAKAEAEVRCHVRRAREGILKLFDNKEGFYFA